MSELKRTPLYDVHIAAGGKMVQFAGYEMPVQYATGVVTEHMTVREYCGLFDVSHMGEIVISGEKALEACNYLMTNDFSGMNDGDCHYTLICNEQGGIVDDLLVYRQAADRYLLIVNAANRDKDREWLLAHLPEGAVLEDDSDKWGQLALQGPKSDAILSRLVDPSLLPEKYYTFKENINVGGVNCLVSRTGYTGEDGFELYCAAEDTPKLWEVLLAEGKEDGLIPCGLGARDTLRLEAGMPLYGHEMTDDINPFEARLGIFVKLDKEDFIGKEALAPIKGNTTRTRVGFKMVGRGIAREGAIVQKDGKDIGVVTSGTHCPYLGYAIAMAMVDKGVGVGEPGDTADFIIRNKPVQAEVVKTPFYKKG